jgi:hypothetical protein
LLLAAGAVSVATAAAAPDAAHAAAEVPAQAPDAPAVPAPAAATDLKFRDFYKLPVGPRGLEPTATLLALDGKPVRVRGYMARQDAPVPGVFILSPLPVDMGDEDETLVDDLPPAVVFVHLGGQPERLQPYVPGIVEATGVLSLGPLDEPDGHVSQVRLQVDAARPDALLVLPQPQQVSR